MPRELQTERLTLRPFTAYDADAAFEVFESNPEVWKHDPGFGRTKEQRAGIIARYAADNDPEGVGTLAIVLRSTSALMGYVGLQHYLLPREPLATPEIELYYKLGRDYWGQGYATEASRTMLRFAFDTLRLNRIVTITGQDNQRSLKLLARLGMRVEPAPAAWPGMLMGTLDNDRAAPPT
jgi:RimJ/RimL family protein N-acetyltransferase